jgi:uroporphyrin-III C-methyltransferase/precorrin-2 dehydrogenase/sirohydrochlorin ferrochelatase
MTLHSLPIFVRLAGRPVILVGGGEAAEAKRRLLERAGAVVVGEGDDAALAIVADDDDAVARLKARGVLVNAVDRPELCDFTLPAIVDRAPVLIAIGTGGVSAGLAATLRQRLEAILPAGLGRVAEALQAARGALRARYPDMGERRRAIQVALAPGGVLDPLVDHDAPDATTLAAGRPAEVVRIRLRSADPDDLTLREARWLAAADRVTHRADVPSLVLDRARADAPRDLTAAAPALSEAGLTVDVAFA